ncbi:hypothetical protein DCCM_4607 [Desulfocucumis palustris]|uniref:Uncharacterized protein n=1 Tax=Desulfocucumis palustris TaxID=1898651 RepID=A0A2L2XGW3_9FIRM|nr:hypothetical protein DCCM_4607 [Desulfocucumis palustris]
MRTCKTGCRRVGCHLMKKTPMSACGQEWGFFYLPSKGFYGNVGGSIKKGFC